MKNFPLSRLGAAAAAVASLAAYAQDSTLKPVTVTAQPDSYVVPASNSTLRDTAPIEQIPQSVIVVPRKLIEDQGAANVTDALRNVSNVRGVDLRDFYNEQFRIRGFRAATSLDGVSLPSMFSNLETTVNIERIEVIKGPAPSLSNGGQAAGGNGFVGGAVAISTKSPEPVARREVGLRLGTRSEYGAFFDLNQPVNDTVGLRLVGEAQHNGSETDRVFFKRTSIFPSLSVRPNADSELLLKLRFSNRSTLDYSGLPPQGTLLPAAFTVPRSLNVSAEGQPDSTSSADGINLQWKQAINSAWNYTVQFSHTTAKLDQNGVFTDDIFAPNPGPTYFLSALNLTQKVKSTTLSTTLRGEVNTAGLKHRLAFGVDLDRTTDFGYMAFGTVTPGVFDITAPTPQVWGAPVPNIPGAQDNKYRSSALFAQDRITVGNNLHLLAGLRYTSIKVDNQWPDFGVSSNTKNSKVTPRVGMAYEFTPQMSAFAGYGAAFTVPTNGIYTTPPKPEEARQTEIGLRLKGLSGVNATVAWFDLRRINSPVSDPANPFQSIQTGEQRSRGIDADVTWSVNHALTLLAHLTSQDPTVTKDTVLTVGSQLFNTPKTSYRIAARYEFSGDLKGLGGGVGLSHQSRLPGNNANAYFTPAATLVDAQVSYVTGGARYALSISNLADKKYYEPSAYFGGGHVTPANRRAISATASYTF